MTKTPLFAITFLCAASAIAHADPRKDLQGELTWWAGFLDDGGWTEEWIESPKPKQECLDLIAGAKKRGVKDSDTIAAYAFKSHPRAVKVGGDYEIPVGEAAWICDGYVEAHGRQTLRLTVSRGYRAYLESNPDGSNNADHDLLVAGPKQCIAAIDTAIDKGMPATTTLKLDRDEVTLEAARVVCKANLDDAEAYWLKWKAAREARLEEMAAPYRAQGAKEDKLHLLASNGHAGWYLKGCRAEASVKALIKASVWFDWRVNEDDSVTVSKYQFKGQKLVKTTDRTYLTEKMAYKKGCK